MIDLFFVTAGLGARSWEGAAHRLGRQAKYSRWFKSVTVFTTTELRQRLPHVFEFHGEFISANARGFGYWIWRPYILQHILKQMPREAVLVYLDAGCELNLGQVQATRLDNYAIHARDFGSLAMRTRYEVRHWCKMDTLVAMGFGPDLRASTLEPGVLFLSATPENLEFINAWIYWSTLNNYHLLDDSPSLLPNVPDFIEHRHDQAIFTLLNHGNPSVGIDQQTDFAPDKWQTLGREYPIWTVRNHHRFLRETPGLIAQIHRKAYRLRKVKTDS